MAYIKLTKGKKALVDDEMFDYLNKHKWHYNRGYAARSVREGKKRRTILMHRVINKTPEDMVTDHINGDTLDNRLSNLRSATPKQNLGNSRKYNKAGLPKGVFLLPYGKYRARLAGKHLGVFDTAEQASLVYVSHAREHYGEFAFGGDR